MISFLIGIITAAIVFYMSMIYGNAALALLGCFMCVFMVLTFIALLVKARRAVAAINIPIAIATQGESIRVSLSCRLKEAGFDIGDYISVTCEDGKIVIAQDVERAAVKAAEAEFMEREMKALQKRYETEKAKIRAQMVAEQGARW